MAKAKKRQAMGRGLSALLPTDENLVQGSVEGKVIELPLDQILGNLNLSSLYQIMSPKTEAVNMAKSISMQFKMGDGQD